MKFFFSNQVLDTDTRELSREDMPVALEPQVFDLVVHLMENRDRVVSKEELIDKIWHGRHVAESTLTSRINAARKAVGDSGAEQALIRTIARKGFRFVAAVQTGTEDGVPAEPAAPHRELEPQVALLDRPGIAVLPFINMSGDRSQEYFSDGISEDIITALSKLRWFFVIARNSSFIYKGRSAHISEIARELGVRYVVEGSVRRSGDQVRISAQLNDVTTGSHLWAERFDRSIEDVFAVQDEITEAIVAAVEPHLYAAESFRAQHKPPGSLDAWDLLMRALSHYWRVTREDNTAAIALLEKAIEIDPRYGKALGLLANGRVFGAHMGWAPMGSVLEKATREALAAVEADSEDAWAHIGLAYSYLFARRFDDAIAEFELALRLNPNFAFTHAFYAVTLCYSGRYDEGDAAIRRALRLSPRDPMGAIYQGVGSYIQFACRRYDEAIRMARESMRQRTDFVGAHRVLTASAGMIGDRELSAIALEGLRQAQPGISLQWVARELPMRHAEDREHYLEGLRRAGLK
ncbi:MAG: tetratricopeptide repeat protein [Bradyrhizobium sp.]|nr:tetratricopeptide repeat protein [Bradyrhizobium sp.]